MNIKSFISAVFAVVALTASSLSAAASISDAAAWTSAGANTTSVTNTAAGVLSMHYNKGIYFCAGCGYNYWNFDTVASTTGTGGFDMNYDAFNGWFMAGSNLQILLNGVNVQTFGNNTHTHVDLTVNAGDQIRFLAFETNGDSQPEIWGDIGLSNFSGAFAPADVPEPGSIALLGLGLAGFAAARRKSAKGGQA
ncbi:PEP-CTERM sorting domain-containing protein [Massilia sp. R2A-15]|nr:PEP-CTERM sorting domain-containing protein [Massilia sp. R2A-15]WLI89531.1 PEP-CTERM sorting domain-containing protein [Massilia sp. R2A-15]